MKKEAGFSLVEILVSLALGAMIVLGSSMTLAHLLRVSNQNSQWGRVVHETGAVGYWIGHDLVMADLTLSSGDDTGTPDEELLSLVWKDWATGTVHYARYAILEQPDSLKKIERRYYNSANMTPLITIVAEDIYLAEILQNGTVWKLSIGSQDGSRRLIKEYDIYSRLNYSEMEW